MGNYTFWDYLFSIKFIPINSFFFLKVYINFLKVYIKMNKENNLKFERYKKPSKIALYTNYIISLSSKIAFYTVYIIFLLVMFAILYFSIRLLTKDTSEKDPCKEFLKKVTFVEKGPEDTRNDKDEWWEYLKSYNMKELQAKSEMLILQDLSYTKKDVQDGKISEDEFKKYILSLECLLSEYKNSLDEDFDEDERKQIMKLKEKLKAANQT